MKISTLNLTSSNVVNALRTPGLSFDNSPQVRQAVSKGADNLITKLHAAKCGVTVAEFNSNKEHYTNLLASGYGN